MPTKSVSLSDDLYTTILAIENDTDKNFSKILCDLAQTGIDHSDYEAMQD